MFRACSFKISVDLIKVPQVAGLSHCAIKLAVSILRPVSSLTYFDTDTSVLMLCLVGWKNIILVKNSCEACIQDIKQRVY